MNRQQIEHIETNGGLTKREIGDVPRTAKSFEVLIEEINQETGEGTGNYSGSIVWAHGWDEHGTFWYLKSRVQRGALYKQYKRFPKGRNVIVNEVFR